MSRHVVSASLILAISLLSRSAALAQEPAAPGPEHALLKQSEGTWETAMPAPDGTESKGEAVNTMICNGLWSSHEFKGSFGGAQFEGRGLDGYDPDKKKYVSIWVDSMTAAPMIFEGDYDKATKTLSMTAEGKGPDGMPAKYKSTTVYHSKDHHTFTLYLTAAGADDQPMVTIEYKRKKAK